MMFCGDAWLLTGNPTRGDNMTRNEMVLVYALEQMIELAKEDAWAHAPQFDYALMNAEEAVRMVRLEE